MRYKFRGPIIRPARDLRPHSDFLKECQMPSAPMVSRHYVRLQGTAARRASLLRGDGAEPGPVDERQSEILGGVTDLAGELRIVHGAGNRHGANTERGN